MYEGMTTTAPESPSLTTTAITAPAGVKSLPMLANSIALIMGKLATMGLGFLAWLAAARLFDQREVGLASGAVSAMMLCVQIALFGAGAAVITLYPRHRSNPQRLLNASFTLVTLASLLVAGAFLVIAALFLDQLDVIARRPAYALAFVVMAVSGTLCVLLDQFSDRSPPRRSSPGARDRDRYRDARPRRAPASRSQCRKRVGLVGRLGDR